MMNRKLDQHKITEGFDSGQELFHKVIVLEEIDSTNNEAKRLAEEGFDKGILVVADSQTGGRGRLGRTWESPKGEGVFFSLLLKPEVKPENASMITIVAAMAVREAIEKCTGVVTHIKWPNDIICGNKKVCGILTEMSADMQAVKYVVIGIGINVHNTSFPVDLEDKATSLDIQAGKSISRNELVAETVNSFAKLFPVYEKTESLSKLVDEYNSCLINCGRSVKVLGYKDSYEAKALGINDRGELMVETEDGVQTVNSGEVSVRGIYGYV